jgi:pyruvate dehydrogenase E2 component (dihydrolipoamide acetyltransferase)
MPDFRMPDIGEGLTEAEIVQWHVTVGDTVDVDQIIVEVETAKTVVEIPSPYSGVITGIVSQPGDTVEVGDVLFTIGAADGVAPETADAQHGAGDSGQAMADRGQRTGDSGPRTEGEGDPVSSVKAMPLVRRLAAERGIDLATISGSGPGGAITRSDVESAEQAPPIDGELIPLSATRRAIAEHMSRSWREIPHVTVQADIRAESLLGEMKSSGNALEACVARRLLPVLADFPDFNAAFSDAGVVHRTRRDLGFAVDTEAGLMVVVVRDADSKDAANLSAEFTDLATRAMNRTIGLNEISGQSFTISNIGALGGGHGTPIIPIGTTAILSIGRATQQPVVEDGALTIGTVAPIDLSYDHRVVDGGLGQRFLAATVAALEA